MLSATATTTEVTDPRSTPVTLPRKAVYSAMLDAKGVEEPNGSISWLTDARTDLTPAELEALKVKHKKGFNKVNCEYIKTAMLQGKSAAEYAREKAGHYGFSASTIQHVYATLRSVGEGL